MTLNEPFASIHDRSPGEPSEIESAAATEIAQITDSYGGYLHTNAMCEGITAAITLCHGLAKRAGWWNDPATGEPKDRNDGEMIALMHSELSEALEGIRKNSNDDHLPHRKSVEVELADALIRIFDYAGARNLDLAGAVIEKLAFNQRRADHKPAARLEADGKKF